MIINTRFHRILETFSNYFFLNLLWLLMCLPLFTIFASTTAMFSVVRKWTLKGESISLFSEFMKQFKTNFVKSSLIGLIWTFFGTVIGLYMVINVELSSSILFYTIAFLSLWFVFLTIYLFPVMVHYDISILNVFKYSFIYSISQVGFTLLSGILILVCALIIWLQPIFALFLCSITAHLIYFICHKSFQKINEKRK